MNELLLRRRVAAKSLPYDAEIEYLGSDGYAFINTGLYANFTDNVKLVFKLGTIASSARDNLSFFGAFTAWKNKAFLHVWNNANTQYMCINNYENLTFKVNESNYTNDWHSFILNGNSCSIDSSTKTVSRGAGVTSVPLYVMAGNSHNSGNSFGRGTERFLKYFQLLDSTNNLRLDLIPVRIGQTGYMYDKVSGKLFGNVGTGDFILGPDK